MPAANASRADIIRALRENPDQPNAAIARRLHCFRDRVAAIRSELGMPPSPAGPRPRTLREALDTYLVTAPGGDGHVHWDGRRAIGGSPVLRYGTTTLSVRGAVFRERYGRDPIGRVRPGCGDDECVAGEHMTDRPMRDRYRTLCAAVLGPEGVTAP